MRAANPTFAATPDIPPVAGFDLADGLAPRPDLDTVAGFDALLASLDPDTARHVLRECLVEIALWQHHLRVQDSRYASDAPQPREMFRIG